MKRSIAAVVLGLMALGTGAFAQEGAGNATAEQSTLERVRERGYVICASVRPLPGFSQVSSDGLWSGFDVDLCRAVSTAVFGDPTRVEFRPLAGESRFVHLALGEIDMIARNAPWTMRRDTAYGVTYVATSFFDGQAFMVPSSRGIVSAYELEDLTVCVIAGTEAQGKMREFFFSGQVAYDEVLLEDREDLAAAYRYGLCDALSAPASWLHAIRRTMSEPATHRILPERITKEPLGPVVREGDVQWETIVRWTLFAMINAEELGLTSLNIESMMATRTPAIRRFLGLERDFGTPLGLSPTWMREVVRNVGNYGEMFERHFGSESGAQFLRGQNALWTNGGLLYAPPLP